MAEDYRQAKVNLTVQTDAVLDTVAKVRGQDRGEIIREVMHKWALEYCDISTLLQRRLKAEGLEGSLEGPAGTGRDQRK